MSNWRNMVSLSTLVGFKAARFLERRGYTLSANWQIQDVLLGRHLRRLFNALSVDCVLDVGANNGQYARFLRQHVAFQGPIISFEPIAELAKSLQGIAAAGDPNWVVHRMALGDRVGEADINIMRNTDLSSFRQPSTAMTGVFSEINQIVRTETVPVQTLELLMPEARRNHGFSRPYLKIDTQGHDLAVMRGAGAELAGFVAMQTEMSLRPLYEGAPDWTETLAYLQQHRFAISDLFSLSHDERLRAIEFDCILINEGFCCGGVTAEDTSG